MNKSYKQFSLTTLQLPAPSSSLTKAEYKDAYGIDLDEVDIPSFKLVVYGKEKYPIDQIKAVEGGHEIYFNGCILSITDTVQTSIDVYDVSNAKPIYIHPLLLIGSDNEIYCSLFIFNNSSEDINTKDKLFTILRTIQASVGSTARFPLSGGFISSEVAYYGLSLEVPNQNSVVLYGMNYQGGTTSKNIETLTFSVTDGVNKLN